MSGGVFDEEAAERAAARRAWVLTTSDVIRQLAKTQSYITVLDIWPRVPWPPYSDGRQMGKAIRGALDDGWIAKAKTSGNLWLAHDHIDCEPARTRDGDLVPSKTLIPIYRSLLYIGSDGVEWSDR